MSLDPREEVCHGQEAEAEAEARRHGQVAPLRVLSLGAGVQSTAVLLMSLHGELPPFDHVIFADTQREPREVYEHLAGLESRCRAAGVPLHRASKGDLLEHLEQVPTYKGTGRGAKFCSGNFKRDVVLGTIARLRAKGQLVEQHFGISLDEHHRMRGPRRPFITNIYPLVELRMTRHDCVRWVEAKGYPRPPRSSCVFCPYRTNAEWRHLRDTDPEGWAVALEADQRADGFVHRSCVPLAEADLSPSTDGQPSLFGEECEGLCGV